MGASRTSRPLSAHPAFPVIVALWFAALLGLGTFVVPPAYYEGLVVGTGLAGLVPAAAPPLGDTARLALSAIAALLGALLGLAIATRIRRVQDEPQARTEEATPPPDSPWLADDETREQQPALDGAELDDPLGDEAQVDSPTWDAWQSEMRDSEDPPREGEADRIFQASDLDTQAESTPVVSEDSGQTADEDDEDLQRFAADRLVAGLPRVMRGNFDDDPVEDWSRTEDEAGEHNFETETGLADPPEPEGPDFDEPDPLDEVDGETHAAVDTDHTSLSESSLAELVARFDAALASQRSRSLESEGRAEPDEPRSVSPPEPEAEEPDDPVIAFLRREADRDRNLPGVQRRAHPSDPQAVLRNALDKLDRVSRKS